MVKPVSNNGDDTLSGLNRTGKLAGGNGDDTYIIDDAGDEVVERKNGGTDHVISYISYQLPSEVENLTLGGTDDLWGAGNALNNVIIGNNSANELSGFAGSDRLEGGGGDDRLFGGEGDDILVGGKGSDLLDGGAGADLAIFEGLSADYSFEWLGDLLRVTPATGEGAGDIDDLISVEYLQFDDGVFASDALPTAAAVNVAPVANDDVAVTLEDTSIAIDVLANDLDADGDLLTVVSFNAVSNMGGTVSMNADGSLTYTPKLGFVGTDSFAYGIDDGRGGIATAKATVTVEAAPAPGGLPYYVEALIHPEDWKRLNYPNELGTPVTVTYTFLDAVPDYYGSAAAGMSETFLPFSEQQEQATRDALAHIESFTNVTFVEVASAGEATLTFGIQDWSGDNLGSGWYPVGNSVGDVHGDVWIDADVAGGTFLPGTQGYYVLLHEIGHAMGLDHPALPAGEENRQYTVMDYSAHPSMTGDVTGYQLYDIAALQYLYGAGSDAVTADDVYGFSALDGVIKTIWDGGGQDSIDLSAATYAVDIDLREGAFSTVAGEGSDNLAIAYGSVIEDAVGGAYNDTLTGNDVANILDGAGGDDVLTGGAGADIFVFQGGWGRDVVADFTSGQDILDFRNSGATFADLIVTTDGADTQIAFNDNLVTLAGVDGVTQADFLRDLA